MYRGYKNIFCPRVGKREITSKKDGEKNANVTEINNKKNFSIRSKSSIIRALIVFAVVERKGYSHMKWNQGQGSNPGRGC